MGLCKLLGGGVSMGRYVWRKSTGLFVADPTLVLDLKKDAYPTSTLKVTCNDVDLTAVTDMQAFLKGFKSITNTDHEFFLTGGTLYLRYYDPTQSNKLSYDAVFDFDVQSAHYMEMSINRTNMPYAGLPYTMQFEGTKQINTPTPVDFVVSNKQDMYPDKAVKNGYYYELIGQIASENVLSLSDSAYDLTRDVAVEEIRNEVIQNGTNN